MIKYFLSVLLLVTSTFASTLPDSTSDNTLKTNGKIDTVNSEVNDEQTSSDTGLTAKEVIENYISAIGGAEKIYNIVDRTTIISGTVQGINITITSYQKAPDKLKQIIKAGSNEQEIIFNGKRGVMKMAGEDKEIKGSQLEKLKFEAMLALLVDPQHYGIKTKLEGIEKVNGSNTYKVIMILPSGIRWTQYYDTETGLKVKELKYIKAQAGLYQQEIDYSDYKESDGILYPFKIKQTLGAQTMEFTVDSISVNTGLTDREFEIE